MNFLPYYANLKNQICAVSSYLSPFLLLACTHQWTLFCLLLILETEALNIPIAIVISQIIHLTSLRIFCVHAAKHIYHSFTLLAV